MPAAVALILAPEQIITSLFGYGSFNQESVANTAIALTFFAFGVPAFSVLKIFSNYFFARNDNSGSITVPTAIPATARFI